MSDELWVIALEQCPARLSNDFRSRKTQCVLDCGHSGDHVADAGPEVDQDEATPWQVDRDCEAYREYRPAGDIWRKQQCRLKLGHSGDHLPRRYWWARRSV